MRYHTWISWTQLFNFVCSCASQKSQFASLTALEVSVLMQKGDLIHVPPGKLNKTNMEPENDDLQTQRCLFLWSSFRF